MFTYKCVQIMRTQLCEEVLISTNHNVLKSFKEEQKFVFVFILVDDITKGARLENSAGITRICKVEL